MHWGLGNGDYICRSKSIQRIALRFVEHKILTHRWPCSWHWSRSPRTFIALRGFALVIPVPPNTHAFFSQRSFQLLLKPLSHAQTLQPRSSFGNPVTSPFAMTALQASYWASSLPSWLSNSFTCLAHEWQSPCIGGCRLNGHAFNQHII